MYKHNDPIKVYGQWPGLFKSYSGKNDAVVQYVKHNRTIVGIVPLSRTALATRR